MKVYVIDMQGCEWGGLMNEKAFSTRERAQSWIADHTSVIACGPNYSFTAPTDSGVDSYEIAELEVEGL